MNSTFWDNMAKIWCVDVDSIDMKKIDSLAIQNAITDKQFDVKYSKNPLDDILEDDDWDE